MVIDVTDVTDVTDVCLTVRGEGARLAAELSGPGGARRRGSGGG